MSFKLCFRIDNQSYGTHWWLGLSNEKLYTFMVIQVIAGNIFSAHYEEREGKHTFCHIPSIF